MGDPSGNSPTVNVIIEKGMVGGIIYTVAPSLMQSMYERQLLVLVTNRYRRSLKQLQHFDLFMTLVPQEATWVSSRQDGTQLKK